MNDPRSHIRPLTSLRFFAALLVFIHHLPLSYGPKLIAGPIGAVGVSFFFVLSGFILTYVYSDRINNWKSIREFWFARFARIWPLHVLTLLICVFGVVGLANSFRNETAPLSFALNFFLLQVWVPDNSWSMGFNHVSWSIATEAFFYLVFPLFILMSPRKFWFGFAMIGIVMLIGIGFSQAALSLWIQPSKHNSIVPMVFAFFHVNPIARLAEFLAGMATGKIFLKLNTPDAAGKKTTRVQDTKIELCTLAAAAIYMVALFQIYFWTRASGNLALVAQCIGYTGGSFIFPLVIYTFATKQGLISKLLSTRLLVYLGEVSFAFYMIHQLVLRLIPNIISGFAEQGFAVCAVSTFILSLGLAALLHGLVEIPTRNFLVKLYRKDWRHASRTTIASCLEFLAGGRGQFAVVALVVGSLMIFHSLDSRFNQQFSSDRILPVVLDSDLRYLPLRFGEDAILHGATIENQADGGLKVKLVWEKQRTATRHRFIHVVDSKDKIICNPVVKSQQKNFVSLPAKRKFIEEIVLTPEQLAGGAKIGIGLYNHDLGTAQVLGGGQLSMNGCRLDLGNLVDSEPDQPTNTNISTPVRHASSDATTLR